VSPSSTILVLLEERVIKYAYMRDCASVPSVPETLASGILSEVVRMTHGGKQRMNVVEWVWSM
jgi:hypothetical protein